MPSTNPARADDPHWPADFEEMALGIAELERIAAHPLLAAEAESLRSFADHLRTTMDTQFDFAAGRASTFPWWQDRLCLKV